MPLTYLQMVQQTQKELGLPVTTTVANATDATTIQMGALANRVLDELRRMHQTGWTALQWEFNLPVTVPITTTGNMVANSSVITNISPNTTGLNAYDWTVSGPGIPIAARIQSVDSLTQVTMTMENSNTSNLTAQSIVFAKDTYNLPTAPAIDWWQNRSMWDRTNRWELLGPDSPQLDQWHRSGIVVTGPRRHFRIEQDQVRIWPPPAEIIAPIQLVFEYMSIAAVAVNGVSTMVSQYFVNDNDTSFLDDQAITMGIKWMFWEIKGFGSYLTLQNRWIDYVERLIARDGAAPTLNLVQRVNPIFLSPANIQDGFFPGPVGPNTGI